MNEYEMIKKIIEPISVTDGKFYFYDKYGKQIELKALGVSVKPGLVSIFDYYGRVYSRHEVYLSTLGCDEIPYYHLESFGSAIRRAMQSKFGLSEFDYSDVECNDRWHYQFNIEPHKTIKYRNEYEKKWSDLSKKIENVCKLIKEKECELEHISYQYHNLMFERNRLPFYALKQKKEFDKKILAVKPKYDSLISEICILKESLPRLMKERDDAMHSAIIRF